jgi:hypothetical protein
VAANPDRLGLRGTFNLIESTLRIIGGANATGALASGAAFHAFHGNVDAQLYIKTAGVLFLLGVIAFCVAFAGCFCSAVEARRVILRTLVRAKSPDHSERVARDWGVVFGQPFFIFDLWL